MAAAAQAAEKRLHGAVLLGDDAAAGGSGGGLYAQHLGAGGVVCADRLCVCGGVHAAEPVSLVVLALKG